MVNSCQYVRPLIILLLFNICVQWNMPSLGFHDICVLAMNCLCITSPWTHLYTWIRRIENSVYIVRNLLALPIQHTSYQNSKYEKCASCSSPYHTPKTKQKTIQRQRNNNIILLHNVRPSDAIWRHRSGSALPQIMACCLTAPNHYLNQCWLIISKVLWLSSEGNFIRDTSATIHRSPLLS